MLDFKVQPPIFVGPKKKAERKGREETKSEIDWTLKVNQSESGISMIEKNNKIKFVIFIGLT